MISDNQSICPKCGGQLKYYDHVRRLVRTKFGNKRWVAIRRLRCCNCHAVHRELPDFIFQYKQYEADIIIGVLEGLIKELKKLFPGCIVMKSDSGYLQGIPDLLILFNDKWAALECKQHAGAKKQPNQEYYVGKMDEMSFSRFICPENKEEVLHDLQQSFQS